MTSGPAPSRVLDLRVWWTTYLPVALSLIPLIYLIRVCLKWHVDVPFGDQWELIPRLGKLYDGTLSFNDVWQQHNEHRPMFPLIVMLLLAKVTAWNINAEIAANVVLGVGMFLICATALETAYRGFAPSRWWLLPPIAVLLFSVAQWENWLWGWQIAIFLGAWSCLLGLWELSRPDRRWAPFVVALACGVVSTYSFASGLTFWIIGLIALRMNPAQRDWRRLAVWTAVAALTIASYFHDYHANPGHPPMMANFRSLESIEMLIVYILKYLGAPVVNYIPALAGAVGGGVLAAFLALLVMGWRDREATGFIFPAVVGLNAVADAVMTALGRAGFGSDQAMASRYGTLAAPIWIATCFLAIFAIERGALKPWATLVRTLVFASACGLSLSVLYSADLGLVAAQARMHELRSLRAALFGAWDWPKICRLYGNNIPLVQQDVAILKTHRLSVFRDQ